MAFTSVLSKMFSDYSLQHPNVIFLSHMAGNKLPALDYHNTKVFESQTCFKDHIEKFCCCVAFNLEITILKAKIAKALQDYRTMACLKMKCVLQHLL